MITTYFVSYSWHGRYSLDLPTGHYIGVYPVETFYKGLGNAIIEIEFPIWDEYTFLEKLTIDTTEYVKENEGVTTASVVILNWIDMTEQGL